MYINKYETEIGDLKQILIELNVLFTETTNTVFSDILNAIRINSTNESISIRLSYRFDIVKCQILISSTSQYEQKMFVHIETLLKESFGTDYTIIATNSEFERNWFDLGKYIYHHQPTSPQGKENFLINDFKIINCIDNILNLCLFSKSNFSYQINLRPFHFNKDEIISIKRNQLRIDEESKLPDFFRLTQSKLHQLVLKNDFISDEFLICETHSEAIALTNIVRKQFRAELKEWDDDYLDISFEDIKDSVLENLVIIGIHTSFFTENTLIEKLSTTIHSNTLIKYFTDKDLLPHFSKYLTDIKHSLPKNTEYQNILHKINKRLLKLEDFADELSKVIKDDLRSINDIYIHQPASTLIHARRIAEIVIEDIYLRELKKTPSKSNKLHSMIEELIAHQEKNKVLIFPSEIGIFLHTIRFYGNLIAHPNLEKIKNGQSPNIKIDQIEIILMITAEIVEWYFSSYLSDKN